jgi:hypothetical protein
MRDTEASAWIVQKPWRGVRLAIVALGIGLVMTSGAVRAADDEEDDRTFEEKIIDGLMAGVGGTNMENKGIDYRERSPLVVPPKLDLPPPATGAEAKVPNWPKDPDEARRKAAATARKKATKPEPYQAARPLTPDELNVGRTATAARTSKDPIQPGVNNSPMLSPSQLGYEGGLMGMFRGNKTETTEFKGEPPRESLVEPPPGYQTPSPNFAYGTGPKESLNKNFDVMTGKDR